MARPKALKSYLSSFYAYVITSIHFTVPVDFLTGIENVLYGLSVPSVLKEQNYCYTVNKKTVIGSNLFAYPKIFLI